MNTINRLAIGCLALLTVTGNVVAQTITVGDASGVAGGQATVQLNWDDNGGVYRSLQFDVNFDQGVLPTVDTGTCPIEPYITGYLVTTCEQRAVPNDNQVRLGLLLVAGEIDTGNLGQLTFDIGAGASPGTTDLTLTGVVIENDPVPVLNNGQITILGPAYSSSPGPGALDVGSVIQNDVDIAVNVDISNIGAVGTTLTGTCSETADPDGVFSVSGTTNFSVPQGGAADTVTVTCDSAGSIATHTGTMECSHNGDNIATPAVYNLSCTITAGPQPAYSSNPSAGSPIDFGTTEEGDPIADMNVAISNSGDSGTTLSGTCSISGDPQIGLVGGAYSVAQGAPAAIQVVSCDSAAQGNYGATLSCTHNGSNLASPVGYIVSCDIGPAGAAIYQSTPAPGAIIDIAAGQDPWAGQPDPDPTSPLQIRNGATDPNDNDLDVLCTLVGAGAITVSPTDLTTTGVVIAPNGMSDYTLSCDTAVAGDYTADLDCAYDIDGDGMRDDGTALYDLECSVREPESVVQPTPPSGTTITELTDPGGSAVFSVVFDETADEGLTGSVDSCSLADGTNFVIDTVLPAAIPAGGSVTVEVTGTDPGGAGDSISDTLNCIFSDSGNVDPPVNVSYPLVLQIGGAARFAVTKTFDDGFDDDVTVMLTCTTGLPLEQEFTISPANPVVFVVTSFGSGEMNCSVTEGTESGYMASYSASGDSTSIDDDPDAPGCHFFDIAGGANNACDITNSPAPVEVDITKVWDVDGAVGEEVSEYYLLTLYCDAEIVNGFMYYPEKTASQQVIFNGGTWFRTFEGEGNDTFTAEVIPEQPSSSCWVEESILSSGVEVDNGCTNIVVSVGNGDSCTITNTVFYEGIPTLSQWGMAIMALLMLSVGLVGFRRFA